MSVEDFRVLLNNIKIPRCQCDISNYDKGSSMYGAHNTCIIKTLDDYFGILETMGNY